MSEKQIKRMNKVQIVGTLAEVGNLVYDKDATNKKNSKLVGAIVKSDYAKPSFVVDVDGQKIGIDTMPTYKDKVDKESGKIVSNDRFKALETVMDYEVGTRVKIDGQINVGTPYMGKNGIFEKVTISAFTISSSNVPTKDGAEGKVSGYIKSIKNETRGEDEDETGRLLVDFWIVNYDESISSFPLIVDKDIADGFEETYDDGDSVILDYDIVTRQVGGKKSKSAGFGRKESNIVGGYSVTEYSIFNGEPAFDDESDYYIDEDVFKKLFKAHKQKCEEAKNSSSNNNDTSTSHKGLGSTRKSKIEDDVDEDDDNPFDD